MTKRIIPRLAGLFLVIGLTRLAHAQPAPPFDAQKFEDQGRQLLEQLQQPGADQQAIMQQAGQLMQQFREQTANMSPDQVNQIRQQMMQHLQPLIIKSMPTIMARMQQGFMDRLREQLGGTDEEFAAMKPALQKVLDCTQTIAAAAAGRGGFGGGMPSLPQTSPLAQAMTELHAALEDTDSSATTIREKIDAVRKARADALHELEVARAELRPLLTIRQESVLVASGLLE